ncbi:MAG TPA: 5'-3' exonuclease H3TH domain-containing protein [Patescibacteria group bacterium]|nr:5'-3' exonuclease H3TH domain-containing protein [Patescibacteria group bacterium]
MIGKLVIIDGNAVMHRAFHAMPPLTTTKGEPINAVHGFVSMLLKVIQEVKPTHLAVAFDRKEKTFRQKELPSYQAQRPEMMVELSSQFEKVREFLDAANIPVYSKAGYEADDVIGTISKKAKKDVVIVTGDRDQLQLVDDKSDIKLYMPVAGLINAKLYGESDVIERMGVPATQIVDLKALTGDASDNYFGVPGIGPKTAETLLSKYKTLKEIYKNLDEISGKVKEKLISGKKSAEQSFMLATIVRDVPIEIDFNKMDKWDLGSSKVINLFEEEFGFKTLTVRIKKIGEDIEKEKQGNLF